MFDEEARKPAPTVSLPRPLAGLSVEDLEGYVRLLEGEWVTHECLAAACERDRAYISGAMMMSTVTNMVVEAADASPMFCRSNRLSMMNLEGTSVASPGPPLVIATTASYTLTTEMANKTTAVLTVAPNCGNTMLT